MLFRSRRADVVTRFGGEEFAVILPDTDAEGAQSRAETIRQSIAQSLNFTWNGAKIEVTVSIGVATVTTGCRVTADDVIDTADKALYEAKQNGRDIVVHLSCTASAPSGSGTPKD